MRLMWIEHMTFRYSGTEVDFSLTLYKGELGRNATLVDKYDISYLPTELYPLLVIYSGLSHNI